MSAYQMLQRGIQAIQAGDQAGGQRLLLDALDDITLKGRLRATANIWLAEISPEPKQKRRHYNAALEADPDNEWAIERLADLLQPSASAPAPPLSLPEDANPLVAPPPPAPIYAPPDHEPGPPPATLPEAAPAPSPTARSYSVVGIRGGPNGPGSGFFLTTDGLIASTRFVTGPQEQFSIELEPGLQVMGRVLRSFPAFDIALIQCDYTVPELAPESAVEHIPPGTTISYSAYGHSPQTGHRRETGRRMPPHIFPTDIVPVPDAGGGPVRNAQGEIVGMLTRNVSTSSSYVYGIHIASIRRCLQMYQYELRSVSQRVYCTSCGYASAAVSAGGYYCETCGTLMPQAREQAQGQQSPHMAALYDENSHPACTACGAKFGFYEGLCLRCGQAGDPGSQRAQPVEY